MRILFVHTIAPNKYGGGERWVVKAASGLKNAGHQVFVASWSGSVLLKEARQAGVSTAAFNIFSDLSIYQAIRLARFIRKHKIEAVVSKRRDLAVAGMAARWAGNPVVLVRSGSPPQRSVAKHVFLMRNLAAGIVTNTLSIKEFYLDHGLPPTDFIRVIYNGLKLYDNIESYDFSDEFPGKKIILCLGRVVSDKGYYHLIDALQLIKKKDPDILAYVIGEGKDKTKMKSYAGTKGVEEMIYFAGYKSFPVPYIKGCHLFLHPSLYEGMPNAPMEAMAYGKPVIMTRVNGADELSNDGKNAVLIPPASSQAIADAVISYFDKPEAYVSMAQSARKFVREKFTMDVMVKQLEQFILDKKMKGNDC